MKFRYLPCYVDIYWPQTQTQDESGHIELDYALGVTVECSFTAVNPQSHLEKFGERYENNELIRITIPAQDGENVDLQCKVARLRHKTRDIYYYPDSIFDVDSINPVHDWRGKPVSMQLFCVLSHEKRATPEDVTLP